MTLAEVKLNEIKSLLTNKLGRRHIVGHIVGSLAISREKVTLLEKYGWYRNIKGGYAHPHAMDYMSFKEIHDCTPAQLEYKLQHGSLAPLPADLA